MVSRHTIEDLRYLQSLPLEMKIRLTKQRIREWIREYGEDGVYVSFSGGKDSTVLLDIVREEYPNVKAMFVDVPTQYPELKAFAKTFDNVDIVKSKMSFMEVCDKYGFPLISKEVSECVYGARKYLKSFAESVGGAYEYRLDKLRGFADEASLKRMSGGVRQEVPQSNRDRRVWEHEWNKLNGKGKFSPPSMK